MSIPFECPTCAKHLKAPDAAAGKSSKCPGCGGKVTCPAPAKAAGAAPKPAAVKPPKARSRRPPIHSRTRMTAARTHSSSPIPSNLLLPR